jgi:hypothetical protein
MKLYRVTKRLWTGKKYVERGCVGCLRGFSAEQIETLLRVGAIAVVSAPPLAELPKWSARADKLAVGGIVDLADVVTAEVEVLAALARVRPTTAARWQAEAEAMLTVVHKDECCGGGGK